MGLIHWWPLRGDTIDRAGSASIRSGSYTESSEGKLGKCAKLTSPGMQTNVQLASQWSHWKHSVSMSCWVKINFTECNNYCKKLTFSSSATNPTGCLIGQTSYGGLGIYWRSNNNMYNNGSTADLTTINFRGYTRGSGSTASTGAYTVEYDKWYHMILVADYDKKVLRFYVNGTQVGNDTSYAAIPEMTDTRYFGWGRGEVYGGNGPGGALPMYVNDVRLYDHALSAAEIHELKSGLLIHYNFEGCVGSTNLKTNPNSWSSSYSCDGSGTTKGNFTAQSDGSVLVVDNNTNTRFYSSQRIPVKVGDKLTFSIKYKLVSGTEETFRWQIGEYNAVGTRVKLWWSQDTQKVKDLNDGWKLYYYHFTATASDVSEIRFYLQDGVDYTKYTHSYYLRDFKLEKGHIDNPIFEATGYLTEYDCSGNELHGAVTGVENCCDAATGKHSAYFPLTGSQYITIPNPSLDNKNISVSVWWKSSNTSAKGGYHILFATSYSSSVSSVEISIPSSGLLRWGFVIDDYRTTNNTTITPHLNTGQWRHIVITYDGDIEKAYVDGVQVGSRTRSGSISYPAIKDSYIGKYVGGSYGATDAYISDVRVYNTTLNADDVTRLYKHTVKITPEQNLLGESLVEQDWELDYYTPSTWKTTGWGGAASVTEEGVQLNAYNGWENFALLTPNDWLNQDLIFSFDYKWTGELPNSGAWVWQNTTNSYTASIQNLIKDNNTWHHCTVLIPSAKTYVGIMIRGTDESRLNYPLIIRNISLQPATNTGVQVYPTGCVHTSRYGDSNKTRIINSGILTANNFIEQ